MSEEYYLNIFCGKKCNLFMFPYIKMYALTCCGECYGADVYIVDETEIHDNNAICGCCDKSTIAERKRVLELSRKEYSMMQEKQTKKLIKKQNSANTRAKAKEKEKEKQKKKKQEDIKKQQLMQQKEQEEEDEQEQRKQIAKTKRDTFNNPNKMMADI